jgi:hypothetical protein
MNKDFALGLSLEQFDYEGRKSWKQKAGERIAFTLLLIVLAVFWVSLYAGYAVLMHWIDPNPAPCHRVSITDEECDIPAADERSDR